MTSSVAVILKAVYSQEATCYSERPECDGTL